MKLALPFLKNIKPLEILKVTADSREVTPGTLFFAIRGSQSDGHQLLAEVFQKGAIGAVVEAEVSSPFPEKTFRVPSTRKAFAQASAYFFEEPAKKIKVYGVTGTNGKTTTTFLWKRAFEALNQKAGIIGTVGVFDGESFEEGTLTTPGPYDLQRYFSEMHSKGVRVCAMEVSSIALDQDRTFGIPFEVALFTNFTQDHLDYHKDMETYFLAKQKFFSSYEIQKAVIQIDTSFGKRIWNSTSAKEKISFGVSQESDYRLLEVEYLPSKMRVHFIGPSRKEYFFETTLMGHFNAMNVLGVLASFPEEKLETLLKAFENYPGAPGRLERVPLSENHPLVFVDYAHTPDALENVLKTLQALKGNSKVLTIFGCGGNRDRSKRPLMAEVASTFSDKVFITSDNPREEDPLTILKEIEAGMKKTPYELEVDRRLAIQRALSLARPQDKVLIAGKGHENYQIIGKQKLPFDDREVVLEYYRNASSNHFSKN